LLSEAAALEVKPVADKWLSILTVSEDSHISYPIINRHALVLDIVHYLKIFDVYDFLVVCSSPAFRSLGIIILSNLLFLYES
jgi:hypothetical protein